MRLGRVIIYAKDVLRMASFYGDILGLKVHEHTRTDSWVEFEAVGTKIALHAIPSYIAGRIETPSPPAPREDMPLKLCLEVNDLESTRKRLASLGVPILVRPWVGCDVIDPEGNVVNIYTSPDHG